jgi:hypothetical protein
MGFLGVFALGIMAIFDDTNPAKEDVEFIESIKNDVKWLGFEWDGEIQSVFPWNYCRSFWG